MGSSAKFRPSVYRQLGILVTHIKAFLLVLPLVLAGLQCCDALDVVGHWRTAMRPKFGHYLDSLQPHLKHSNNNLQGGSRLTTRNQGAAVGAGFGSATSRRDLTVESHELSVTIDANSSNRTAPRSEVEALLAFKSSISNDPLHALKSWVVGVTTNGSEMCSQWVGVSCSPQPPTHVIALDLSQLQLAGTLNRVLLTLSHLPLLQSLDLSYNFFMGPIQGESIANFSHLSYFNLSYNIVTGDIPFEIGELVSLKSVDLSYNNLTGLIPGSLANCSLLKLINLEYNALHGDIPPALGKLSTLYYLALDNNYLSGSVPIELGNCSMITDLILWHNYDLGPDLPQSLSQLPLKHLSIGGCNFVGFFPLWIVNITSLEALGLSYNQFFGEIPNAIGQLALLTKVTMGGNNFTGALPPTIANCTLLTEVQIETCSMTGQIPSEIGLLSSLEILNLHDNYLTGVIPSSLSNCSAISILELGTNFGMDPEPIPLWMGSLTNLALLFLSGMNLEGEIPEFLGKLSNLEYLALAENNLTGRIPIALGNCSYLSELDLGVNQLTGEIPSELGELTYMSFFGVVFNRLTGSFPEFVANWTQLTILELYTNLLSGPVDGLLNIDQLVQLDTFELGFNHFEGLIPETLGNSSSIQSLGLSDNRFTGVIPAALGNISNLHTLYLENNRLQGEIPVHLFKPGLPLGVLNLRSNQLEGSIPFEIGQFVQLAYLDLSVNNFGGMLPSSFSNFSGMSLFDVSHNQFEGDIPAAAISKWSASLLSLNLSNNLLSGSWPREFSQLTVIEILNVASNNISGSIPLGLGHCVSLTSLDVSNNKLTGEIPQDLGALTHLKFFNASFNDFSGPIPHSGFFNSNRINASSFLGNLGLCGPPSIIGLNHQECPTVPSNVSTHGSTHRDCRGFGCKKIWIPVTVLSTLVLLVAVLIIVGSRSRWILCRGCADEDFETHVMLNFGTQLKISERDVLQIIHDKSGENIIGTGARSIVYKGVLAGGEVFALKKLLRNSNVPDQNTRSHFQGAMDDLNSMENSELVREAGILAQLRHKNILKCLSFYSSLDQKALILEFMSGGSLHQHLHEMEVCELTWQRRLNVAIGVAQGMKYLHHDFREPLIHGDLKPSNILLDGNLEPKVSDFGISKFANPRRDGEITASTFCGTIGYMPPEYASQPWVSTKGDVYSYGMVLIELLTRRQASSTSALEDHGRDLRSLVLDSFHERPLELLDHSLIAECNLDSRVAKQVLLLLRLSLFCTRGEPQSRPSMVDVIGMLTHIIDLGVEPFNRRTLEELANISDPKFWVMEDPSIEGSEFGSS